VGGVSEMQSLLLLLLLLLFVSRYVVSRYVFEWSLSIGCVLLYLIIVFLHRDVMLLSFVHPLLYLTIIITIIIIVVLHIIIIIFVLHIIIVVLHIIIIVVVLHIIRSVSAVTLAWEELDTLLESFATRIGPSKPTAGYCCFIVFALVVVVVVVVFCCF
jgi:hypothetical protein